MQITEDTPPDMLAGAMDLTVHLPKGRTVKMAVERSTPMMDLLVQVTTANQLQLSNYTLQALGMAPLSGHTDKNLPYQPNTPIGTLDTQHIKVVPKTRTIPVPKNVAPGHQPFESTFRLKVHLPRNQLYVARVSRNLMLEDIMRKVCEEKNLDAVKYEFRHPGNIDQTLDPKLTLSHYQITEIYCVAKGGHSLSQAFSTSDIMALRKEEERKQMHNKTGGGVFNLIFRRGKSSMGSGSISSETRSISPTHSDDSRSVTPPAVIRQPILPPPKQDPPPERPKPPQRKRRPAPKPPQLPQSQQTEDPRINIEITEDSQNSDDKTPTNLSEVSESQSKKTETSLVICHSRNSSDSSGYHEASVLSENCNTSLPRRPKSAFVGTGDMEKLSKMHSQSTTNLSKMASHSKSTTSLIMTGRKKKIAPPPPPAVRASNPSINLELPSPVVASQSTTPTEATPDIPPDTLVAQHSPTPLPRSKTKAPPVPRPRNNTHTSTIFEDNETPKHIGVPKVDNDLVVEEIINEVVIFGEDDVQPEIDIVEAENELAQKAVIIESKIGGKEIITNVTTTDINGNIDNNNVGSCDVQKDIRQDSTLTLSKLQQMSCLTLFSSPKFTQEIENEKSPQTEPETQQTVDKNREKTDDIKNNIVEEVVKQKEAPVKQPPEIVAVTTKVNEKRFISANKYDSFGKRRLQKLPSLTDDDANSKSGSASSRTSVSSALAAFNFIDNPDEFFDIDERVFTGSIKKSSFKEEVFNELFGIHHLEDIQIGKNQSISSLRSLRSFSSFVHTGNGMRKWNNLEDLDDISLTSQGPNSRWAIGGDSEPESLSSPQALDSLASITSCPSNILTDAKDDNKPFGSTDSGIAPETSEKLNETEDFRPLTPPPPPLFIDEPAQHEPEKIQKVEPVVLEDKKVTNIPPEENVKERLTESEKGALDDIDWQYQLPSPPKAFRDSSPTRNDDASSELKSDFKDSVVTSPELFEKLKHIEDTQSVSTFACEEPPLNTLSLEHLEKRKSLVYNRELSTSLKMNEDDSLANSLNKFESTFVEVQKSSQNDIKEPKFVQKSHTNTLPNFRISTYDRPKQKIKVFEDDTIRSNTDYINKTKNNVTEKQTLNTSFTAMSVENISVMKTKQHEEKEYAFYRPEKTKPNKNVRSVSSVFRSESFSSDNTWSINKPVSRSKSFLTLNGNAKHNLERRSSRDENFERSNSLYDVSGLQSLGVMRLIQNKLNTPRASLENINMQDKPKIIRPEQPKEARPADIVEKPVTEKIYKYCGPPAINMGTWSDRPKVPVSVKKDEDYILENSISSKLIVNTTNNNITSNNSIEIKNNNKELNNTCESSISIKINSSEISKPTPESKTGVVIKIGGVSTQPKTIDNQTFINHTTATGYRKPFTDINKNQRPYTVAFGSEYDSSRVPVVRSVELKKAFKDLGNTSVTHIYQEPLTANQQNGFMDDKKQITRVRSFNPVVRGFKPLPKERETFEPNSQVPFSQVTLRRTESNKMFDNKPTESETIKPSPPPLPPMMTKVNLKKPVIKHVEAVLDPRDQLLSQIRNFGGKKGLKSMKV